MRNEIKDPVGDKDPVPTEEARKLKEAEKALRDSEERYRAVFQAHFFGNLIIDPETGRAVEFNDTACRQLGYTPDEFAGLRISDYEAVERPEETEARIRKILLEGSDEFETKHRTKSGEIREVVVSVQTVELGGNPYLYCIYHDITERKQAEENLKRHIEELERFKKATIKRELRMKELRDRVEKMEKEKGRGGEGAKGEGANG